MTTNVIAHGEALAGKDISILAPSIYSAAKRIAGLYRNKFIALNEQQKLEKGLTQPLQIPCSTIYDMLLCAKGFSVPRIQPCPVGGSQYTTAYPE